VTTEWQQVKIPIANLRTDLKMNRMGSLVFWFRYEGEGAVEVDDIAFTLDPEVQKMLEANAPRAQAHPKAPRAVWVWKYDPVSNLDVRKELFEFCERTDLKTIYLYLGDDPILKVPKEIQVNLAGLLKEAHAHGVRIEALQGNPLWALKPYHPKVLEWIGSFLEFNKEQEPDARLDGVRSVVYISDDVAFSVVFFQDAAGI